MVLHLKHPWKKDDSQIFKRFLIGFTESSMSDHLDDTDPNLNEPIYANVNSKKQSSPVQLPDLFEYIRENKKNECEGFKKEFNVR